MSADQPLMEDEVKQISTRLRNFDEDIRQIIAQRVPLLRRLKQIHSSDHVFPH